MKELKSIEDIIKSQKRILVSLDKFKQIKTKINTKTNTRINT